MIARKLEISGIVQGVGFRPFVYQLATKYGINGKVANTASGVSLHLEGRKKDIESFCAEMTQSLPPLAHISEISIHPETFRGFTDFSITESNCHAEKSALISPDVAICNDCLHELFDPEDRRYKYPFINCTNCGPRYTIISDIPYDRCNTSMKHFQMCKACQAEYDDPANRRFHAQPNACPVCGPHVSLYDNQKNEIETENPIEKSVMLLKQGHILAIKGLGGFHLAVDAENHDAVCRLRKRKHREAKPFALMSCNIVEVRKYAEVDPEEEKLLTSYQRPILLLRKKEPNSISEAVAPNNNYFGVILPYTPLHYLIFNSNSQFLIPNSQFSISTLVMTSGNISEEPIAIDNDEAFERLSGIADYFLIHNRDIYIRSDDSILKIIKPTPSLLISHFSFLTSHRRSRGYAPAPIFLKKKVPQVLACGGELKNTICLTKGNRAFLSQHIGDMENLATYNFFQETIHHIKKLFDIEPEIIAHDLHPDYMSTQYALEQQGIKKIPVQHHHAHIVSCMAENLKTDPVIGLVFDGTGYGTDGKIWGGEVLIAEPSKFRRAAYLSYFPMPGGAAAIKEPWRMAISYLYHTFGNAFWNLDLPVIRNTDEKKIKFLVEMMDKKINSPETSSLGRLVDGIAAIIGIRNQVFFEGQAAMEMEMLAEGRIQESGIRSQESGVRSQESEDRRHKPEASQQPTANSQQLIPNTKYQTKWISEGKIYKILLSPLIHGVVKDMEQGISLKEISYKFLMTLIALFADLCEVTRRDSGINCVALSGGVFQNSILLTGLIQQLEQRNFEVITHTQVPCNDEGISLGQAIVASEIFYKP